MGRTARILIVDDHPLICYAVGRLLEGEAGLEACGSAHDVDEALELVDQQTPDLVLVDISLRTRSGIDLLKQLRARHGGMPSLVLSIHDESLFAERVLHAGARGYLNKQQATEKLVEAIRHVLAGHIYLSDEMTDNLLHRVSGSPALGRGKSEVISVERLTDREMEVFELTGSGLTTREIAERLQISLKTVESHRDHIRSKLNIRTGAELTRHAVQWVLEKS